MKPTVDRSKLVVEARAAIKAGRAVIDLLEGHEGRTYTLGRLAGAGATLDDVEGLCDLAAELLAGPVVPVDRRQADWYATAGREGAISASELSEALLTEPDGALWFVDGPVMSECGCGLPHPSPAGVVWQRNPDRRSATVVVVADSSSLPYAERPADVPRHVIDGMFRLASERTSGGHHDGAGTGRWVTDVVCGHLLTGVRGR